MAATLSAPQVAAFLDDSLSEPHHSPAQFYFSPAASSTLTVMDTPESPVFSSTDSPTAPATHSPAHHASSDANSSTPLEFSALPFSAVSMFPALDEMEGMDENLSLEILLKTLAQRKQQQPGSNTDSDDTESPNREPLPSLKTEIPRRATSTTTITTTTTPYIPSEIPPSSHTSPTPSPDSFSCTTSSALSGLKVKLDQRKKISAEQELLAVLADKKTRLLVEIADLLSIRDQLKVNNQILSQQNHNLAHHSTNQPAPVASTDHAGLRTPVSSGEVCSSVVRDVDLSSPLTARIYDQAKQLLNQEIQQQKQQLQNKQHLKQLQPVNEETETPSFQPTDSLSHTHTHLHSASLTSSSQLSSATFPSQSHSNTHSQLQLHQPIETPNLTPIHTPTKTKRTIDFHTQNQSPASQQTMHTATITAGTHPTKFIHSNSTAQPHTSSSRSKCETVRAEEESVKASEFEEELEDELVSLDPTEAEWAACDFLPSEVFDAVEQQQQLQRKTPSNFKYVLLDSNDLTHTAPASFCNPQRTQPYTARPQTAVSTPTPRASTWSSSNKENFDCLSEPSSIASHHGMTYSKWRQAQLKQAEKDALQSFQGSSLLRIQEVGRDISTVKFDAKLTTPVPVRNRSKMNQGIVSPAINNMNKSANYSGNNNGLHHSAPSGFLTTRASHSSHHHLTSPSPHTSTSTSLRTNMSPLKLKQVLAAQIRSTKLTKSNQLSASTTHSNPNSFRSPVRSASSGNLRPRTAMAAVGSVTVIKDDPFLAPSTKHHAAAPKIVWN